MTYIYITEYKEKKTNNNWNMELMCKMWFKKY